MSTVKHDLGVMLDGLYEVFRDDKRHMKLTHREQMVLRRFIAFARRMRVPGEPASVERNDRSEARQGERGEPT